jgi:hypothetical protein
MAQHHQFLSVLKGPSADGDITVNIESFDADENVNITTANIAVTDEDNEITVAKAINTAIGTLLTAEGAAFSSPTSSSDTPLATFKHTRTDHVTCLWSQAQFAATVDVASTGAVIAVQPSPGLMTSPEVESYAPICGVVLADSDGNDFGEDQISFLLQLVSDELCKKINNPLVLTTQLEQMIANGTDRIQLKVRPVINFERPFAKRPGWSFGDYNFLEYEVGSFRLNSRLGTLQYPNGSMLIETREPFAKGNEVLVVYTAGYQNIPLAVKKACLTLAGQVMDDPNLKSLKGGDFAVEFFQSSAVDKYINSVLGAYIL